MLDALAGGFTLPFHVGYLGSSPAGGTGARFDDVRIWSVARSAAEIAGALSEYIEPTTPGLERLYTFDEGAGEVIDATGHSTTAPLGTGTTLIPSDAPTTIALAPAHPLGRTRR